MVRKAFLSFLILALAPAAAQAAESISLLPKKVSTLQAAGTTKQRCDDRMGARRGVDTATYTAPMAGYVTMTLRAARGDWDLGLFDSSGNRLSGSLGTGRREIVQTWVKAGDRLVVQGCHRSGRARTARVGMVLADAELPKAEGTPQLLAVDFADRAEFARLQDLGVDVTHHIHDGKADVIVANDAQKKLLADNGFTYSTEIADLGRHMQRSQTADYRYTLKQGRAGSELPSGRTSYRVLTDYQNELKALAEKHPAIVKSMTLPRKSFQGRELQGVEIASDVRKADEDGRPVYFVVALHHAREWPSAEAAMEFATMLAEGYGKDTRITELLTRTRVVVVPLINPDGFASSRGFPADPADVLGGGGDHAGVGVDPNAADPCEGRPVPSAGVPAEVCSQLRRCILTGPAVCETDLYLAEGIAPPGGVLSYRRKNCNGEIHEPAIPCELQYGVDPNRNYGQFWGGPGSDADVTSQGYRGPSPWSETETQAVHEYSQTRQITTIITIHNVAALVLRPPGTSTQGKAPDEARLKEIGDAMGAAAGYTSQYGFELYDTAGTTEDWNYAAAGTYGYTIEIGPAKGEFHMPYQVGFVDQWTGDYGPAQRGKGLREALLIAGESAANTADHSVITGSTRPGRVLTLRKDFDTPSWGEPFCFKEIPLLLLNVPATDGPRCLETRQPFQTPDFLTSTLTVPASGKVEWHTTPSTRPFLLKDTIVPGEPQPGREDEPVTGSGDVDPTVFAVDDPPSVHEFTITAADAAQKVDVDLTWELDAQDYDLEVCQIVSETECESIGKGSGSDPGSSGNGPGTFEHIGIDAPPVGLYRATIVRYATVANDWTLTVKRTKAGTSTVVPGRREAWKLTCATPDGSVLQTADVIVDRGQVANVDLSACGKKPKKAKRN